MAGVSEVTYDDEKAAKFYADLEHRSVSGRNPFRKLSEETHYQFRRDMYEILHVIMKPLWRYRGQIDRAMAGGLVAFERGFFYGAQIVWDWTKTPNRSEFADWD